MQKLRIALKTGGSAAGRRGFSAIEVTAVAAIIFVLALVLVPIVNKRVDESRITAAQEDLIAFEKAEQMAHGFTGRYYRLHDLERPKPEISDKTTGIGGATTVPPSVADLKVPPAYWNQPLMLQSETSYLVANWSGPFLPKLHRDRSMILRDVILARPEMFNTTGLPGTVPATPQGGPIFVFVGDDLYPDGTTGAISAKYYPLDPWGNPYLFFGSGYYGTFAGQLAIQPADQKFWQNAAVISLGPDGQPGLGGGRAPAAFFRENNNTVTGLGFGDDLIREF